MRKNTSISIIITARNMTNIMIKNRASAIKSINQPENRPKLKLKNPKKKPLKNTKRLKKKLKNQLKKLPKRLRKRVLIFRHLFRKITSFGKPNTRLH